MKTVSLLYFVIFLMTASCIFAQAPFSQLDPEPYNPEIDPNIDMYISNWKESTPKNIYGSLIERTIFTKCKSDPLRPLDKGTVLTSFNHISYGTLYPHESTKPSILKDEQIIFYIYSGKGTITAGGKIADLNEGVGVIMPPGLEFIISSSGNENLTMYIISEPLPAGFTPNKDMLVRDEDDIHEYNSQSHWCHVFKTLFWQKDGLATIAGMGPVWFDPMTMGQPHSHEVGIEEIWITLKGDINLLLGKQLRKLSPGTAYKVPPNGKTPHSNINVTEEPVKLFWFMVYEKSIQ